MDPLLMLGLGSLKALLLLLVALGISMTLRRWPARLRAVVWSTALVGSLLIPAASGLMPALEVELPVALPGLTVEHRDTAVRAVDEHSVTSRAGLHRPAVTITPQPLEDAPQSRTLSLPTAIMSIWALVALVLVAQQVLALVRMRRVIGRARPVYDGHRPELLDGVARQVGCRQRVRMVLSSELEIPAVYGCFRPVIVLPTSCRHWLADRFEAVLQHEMVHIVRFDWPLRTVARMARAFYWFNPLVWWAVRRLDLEQEMACDEEVLSLGSRASSYACHLLGIARTVAGRPVVPAAGLGMARRSHLEERIMRILNRSKHRKIGLAVILPAALLTAALVPAIAAVQPTEPPPKQASPALKEALEEMSEAEQRLEPHLERLEDVEIDMEPILERLEEIEAGVDHEELARIEAELAPIMEKIEMDMAPILAEIEAIEIDMEPVHAELGALHERLGTMTFHIDDGTLEEVQRQIHEQMEAYRGQLESIHIDMEPYHEQLERFHEELEPLQEKLAQLTAEQMAEIHEQLETYRAMMDVEMGDLEDFHLEMEKIHEEMEPLREEMERAGVRLERALVSDLADVLRSHLGPVTSPGASFTEAAARIVDEGNIHLDDDTLELHVSRSEVREILDDLFAGERIGTQEAYDRALAAAVDDVSDLRIQVD
jgi:beta-lactamase regulating signal transducer with metallopeptidase domain